ncbi:hypothetical protein Tco_0555799 [Tanacetum coccineum]
MPSGDSKGRLEPCNEDVKGCLEATAKEGSSRRVIVCNLVEQEVMRGILYKLLGVRMAGDAIRRVPAGMKDWVVGNGNGTSVVTKDGYHLVMNVIVTELTFHPKKVRTTPSSSNILSLSRGHSHSLASPEFLAALGEIFKNCPTIIVITKYTIFKGGRLPRPTLGSALSLSILLDQILSTLDTTNQEMEYLSGLLEVKAHTATISPTKETPSQTKGGNIITEETVSKTVDAKKEPEQVPQDTESILITIVRPTVTPTKTEIIRSSSRLQLTSPIVEVQVP